MSHSPFESYLDLLERSLRSLPRAERAEWREEARQHLQEIARAGEEAGLTPDEARATALRLFGDAGQIAQGMAQAAGRSATPGRTAAALFSGPLIVAMLLLTVLAYAYVSSDSPTVFRVLQGSGVLAFVLVPILGGWRVGRQFRTGASLLPAASGLLLIGLFSLPIGSVLLVPALGVPIEGAALDYRWGFLWLALAACSLCRARCRPLASA